ncbi:MAG: cytochrome c biogenesis protein CcsA [SAR324 cluster bacterium]|nr:cytochrome c biogenesis protein CcsA [SAR324 cluster bacterium]
MTFTKGLGYLTISWGIIAYGWVFLFTSIEVNQGISQKIMYLHVPVILTSYLAILVLFISSIGYLLTLKSNYDMLAVASAEQAVLYLAIALISGSIWGKPTWNTYWTWDARLTISLITFIFFSGYLLFRFLGPVGEKQSKAAAVLAILGFFAVPLNHLAVNWFNTLHQKTTIFRSDPLIDNELYYPLLACMAFFFFLFLWLLILRVKLGIYKKKHLIKLFS